MALHRENRQRLIARFEKSSEGVPEGSVILLKGGRAKMRHETDHEYLFRQESFFHWAFGVIEPDCYGVIDLSRRRSILFVPRLPAEYAVWMGKVHVLLPYKGIVNVTNTAAFVPLQIQPCSHFTARYEVDETRYVDELDSVLTEIGTKLIYTLHVRNEKY